MIATMRGWWLVLATACGSDATPLDTAVSGDRLKIARVEFVDGLETWASVPAGEPDLFDVTLGRACVPRTWSDGIARCTPELAPLVYLDANCSEPHVASGPPRFAADPSPLPVELFFSTTTAIVPAELFERRDGRCVPAPSAALVSPVEPRSLSELVELSTELLGDPPLVVATLRGADGLIVPAGLHDTRTATTCDLAALEGTTLGSCAADSCDVMRGPKAAGETRLHPIYVDELRHPNWLFDTVFETECELVPIGVRQRCVPRAAPAIASFSDPACTAALPLARMPAADDRCGGRVPPRFASRDGFVLGLGAPYRGTAYELVDGACIAVTGELHEMGEIVPEGSLMISDVIRRDP